MSLMLVSACGSKEDDQTKQIFEQGRIDPDLIPNKIGYVPQFPFFNNFINPVDVYVGYDEMVYVVDDRGLNVLDQTGKLAITINIPGATDVTQDRRLHTYVLGRVDFVFYGYHQNCSLLKFVLHTANFFSRLLC